MAESSTQPTAAALPSGFVAAFVFDRVVTIALFVAIWWVYFHGAPHAPAAPSGPVPDQHFVAVGRAYLPELGKVYASAWEQGATALDSGQSLTASIALVGKSWDANRATVFDRIASPEFGKVIPESTKDTDVTPAQRSAMSAAWRGFAAGVSK